MKLEHIGISVEDADAVADIFSRLIRRDVYKTETVAVESVATHFVNVGNTKLEFLESLSPDSALARSIAARGTGLHHLAFEVANIEATYTRVKEAGFRILSDQPYEGADGKLVFFVHPRETARVLIEFCQSARPTGNTIEIESATFEVAGNPDGRITFVLGMNSVYSAVRALEPVSRLIFVPDSTDISQGQIDALARENEPYSLVIRDDEPWIRIDQATNAGITPSAAVVITDGAVPVAISELDGEVLLITRNQPDFAILKNLSGEESHVYVSVLPHVISDQEKESITGRLMRSFLP